MNRYKIIDQHKLHFLTLTIVDWVDLFIRKQYRDIVIESLKFCSEHKQLSVCAYVVMSSHLHLVAEAQGKIPLTDILRDFKKFTARRILEEINHGKYESRKEWLLHRFRYNARKVSDNRDHQIWKSDNHPVFLYSPPVIAQKINYIHQNPVKAGWVLKPEQYIYSSASNYFCESGILDVKVLDVFSPTIGYIPGT